MTKENINEENQELSTEIVEDDNVDTIEEKSATKRTKADLEPKEQGDMILSEEEVNCKIENTVTDKNFEIKQSILYDEYEDLKKDKLVEEYYNKHNRQKNNNFNGVKMFFLIIVSFITGGIFMIGILKFTPLVGKMYTTSDGTVVTQNKTQVYEKGSLAASVEKIYNAVAVIQCYKSGQLASSGTGFVYKVDDKYGYLLTNAHVVNEMEKVTVTFNNSDEEIEVNVLGKDSYLDLAVLRIEKKHVSLVANIGSSENINLGDVVFTVGSPMGYDYRGSVTSGVLSGKDRMVSVNVSSSSNDWVMRVLQLDASINPGNSGGPLLNANGEVIGICSMKLVDDDIEGMGFAIPIEYAMSHVEQLEKGEKIEWPLLGISMANITDVSVLYRYGIRVPDEITKGVVVLEAQKDSGADKAGIKKGDIITKIDGKSANDIAYLRYELYQHTAGEEIEMTLIRDGKEKTVKVKLGKNSD